MTSTLAILVGLGIACWAIVELTRGSRKDVEVSDRGISAPALTRGLIPWEQIEGAYPPRSSDPQKLALKLRDGPGSRELVLDLRDSDWAAVDLLREILDRIPSNR